MLRTDGISDGVSTIQGTRAYDPTTSQWTTPDAYAGSVDDPGSQKAYSWDGNNPVSYADPSGFDATSLGLDGSGGTSYNAQPLFTDAEDDDPAALQAVPNAQLQAKNSAQQGNQSAVPTGLQVEPSQTTFDASATQEYGFHVDDWFYQLTNANGRPVTGRDYYAMEKITPAGAGTKTSNGQWTLIGGTEIKDQVGGRVSSILFQTFDIKYEGQKYLLPQELVHEVTVDPNGETTTRVFEIVPDPMP